MDGKLTFDRLTDVYHSGTKHEEDQPAHLHVADPNLCETTLPGGVREPLREVLPGRGLRDGAEGAPSPKT